MNLKITSKEEFELIFKKYLQPLLGVNDSLCECGQTDNIKKLLIYIKNQKIYFFESKESNNYYAIKVSKSFPDDSLGLLNTIYPELIKIRYKNFDQSINKDYDSIHHLYKNYDYILQRQILTWFSSKCKSQLMELIELLEQWKLKTYEGRKVPFAFIINEDSKDGKIDFVEFLKEEYSATFSDGITSIIELDSNLKFLKYSSITSLSNVIGDVNGVPFRFSQVINTYTKNKIAVFLLANGDILLVKNCEIKLVKREGRWLNFNNNVFKSIISAELVISDNKFLKLLDEIYFSALDVSFAHSGGIISYIREEEIHKLIESNVYNQIVEDNSKVNIESKESKSIDSKSIINCIDNLLPNNQIPSYEELRTKFPREFDNADMKKRFMKRNFLISVINDASFVELDRKLRSELISMDGATIIDSNGRIVSIGAIIQNDSGSSGGGRGAAAKKLSNFGFAIKISTDGYIEVYIRERVKYRIK